jgi:hypothetical protein
MSSVSPPVVLPSTDLARLVLSTVIEGESPAIANHSVRSYLFARLLADELGATPGGDYDEELLFAACVLHDVGLSPSAAGPQRFEVEGADFAAALLAEQGVPAEPVGEVWEAIALHTSGGIAERRGLLCRLTRGGVGLDFGREAGFITDAQASVIHAAYPRLDMERALVDEVVAQARRTPSKAPAYSFADGLTAERGTAPHTSRLERAATATRWAAYARH